MSDNGKKQLIEKTLQNSWKCLTLSEVNALLHDADKCTEIYLYWSIGMKSDYTKKSGIPEDAQNKYLDKGHNLPEDRKQYIQLLPVPENCEIPSVTGNCKLRIKVMNEPEEQMQRQVSGWMNSKPNKFKAIVNNAFNNNDKREWIQSLDSKFYPKANVSQINDKSVLNETLIKADTERVTKFNFFPIASEGKKGKTLWQDFCKNAGAKATTMDGIWPESVWEFFRHHHRGPHELLGSQDYSVPLHLFHAGIGGIDGQDTHYETDAAGPEDRGKNFAQHHHPAKPMIATSFGLEQPLCFKQYEEQIRNDKKHNPFTEACKLIEKLNANSFEDMKTALRSFRKSIQKYFAATLTATGRPMNDVAMADHALSAAALLRSATARVLLENAGMPDSKRDTWIYRLPSRYPNTEIWPKLGFNLLSVAVNIDYLLQKGNKIGDIAGYKKLVDTFLTAVRRMLEDEYGIGGHLYSDQGSIHLAVPCLSDVNTRFCIEKNNDFSPVDISEEQQNAFITQADLDQWIRDIVKDEAEKMSGLHHEMTVGIRIKEIGFELDKVAEAIGWARTQRNRAAAESNRTGDGPTAKDKAREDYFLAGSITGKIADKWEKAQKEQGNVPEICPVCGLRPQTEKGLKICATCKDRRENRLKDWLNSYRASQTTSTIWLADLADEQRYISLIQGRFNLDPWLCEKTQPNCLTFAYNSKSGKAILRGPKMSSPGRLRRVWRTTLEFWESLANDLERDYLLRHRIIRIQKNSAILSEKKLYTILGGKRRYEAISIAEDQLLVHGMPDKNMKLKIGGSLKIFAAEEETKEPVKDVITCTIESIAESEKSTSRKIQIILSPTDFMILVPGNKARDVIDKIVKKYQEEMGRVRHRLSLNVGCLHFRDKYPLYLVLDTARRQIQRLDKTPGQKGFKDGVRFSVDHTIVDQPVVKVQNYPADENIDFERPIEQKIDISLQHKPKVHNAVQDIFYPNIKITAGAQTYTHLHDIKNESMMQLYPSILSYQCLDIFDRRYDFSRKADPRDLTKRFQYPLETWDDITALVDILYAKTTTQSRRKALIAESARVTAAWPKENKGEEITDRYIGTLFHAFMEGKGWDENKKEFYRQSWRGGLLLLAARLGDITQQAAENKEEINGKQQE